MPSDIRFEQWELDDLQREMQPVLFDSVDEITTIDDDGNEVITGYEINSRPMGLMEFLNRVVEVADRHRHRQAIKDAPHAPNVK
jgi:hypothetical protein